MTGLNWLKDANCIATNYSGFDNDDTAGDGKVNWQHALDFVAGINDGTYPDCGVGNTDWRLPNRRELSSLVDDEYYSPALPNTAGTGQWSEGDLFDNVQSYHYWSGTSCAVSPNLAKLVGMECGNVSNTHKGSSDLLVWPVRGGQ